MHGKGRGGVILALLYLQSDPTVAEGQTLRVDGHKRRQGDIRDFIVQKVC